MITVAEAVVLQHVAENQPIPVRDMKYIMSHISGEFGNYIQLTDEGFIITDTGRLALEEYEGAQAADAPDELAVARARIAELEALLSEAASLFDPFTESEAYVLMRRRDTPLVAVSPDEVNRARISHSKTSITVATVRAIADFAARLKATGVK